MTRDTPPMPLRPRLSLLITMLVAGALVGCSRSSAPDSAAAPSAAAATSSTATAPSSAAAAADDPRTVTLTDALRSSVRTQVIEKQAISDLLQVAGQVGFDERNVAKIGSTVTGRVIDIKVQLGQSVKAGQRLAILNSTELGGAQLAYVKARAQTLLNERNVERARQLHAADVIGSAELQRRESELEVTRAEQFAAADQLRVLGVPADELKSLDAQGSINSISPVVSTISGTVVERKITQGQVVQPSDVLFTVANLANVWVVAEVPEQQAAKVRIGQSIEVDIPALGARRTGKLIYVADTVDPQSRTVTVRSELDNRDRQLKPAMLASILIESGPTEQLAVPVGAVVRESDVDQVFVEIGPGRFRLQEVKLGAARGGIRPVLQGLTDGQVIVVDGAFHLNNERKRRAAR